MTSRRGGGGATRTTATSGPTGATAHALSSTALEPSTTLPPRSLRRDKLFIVTPSSHRKWQTLLYRLTTGAPSVSGGLARGAQLARDTICDDRLASADARVGYPMVNVRDIESGKVRATRELFGAD